MYQDDMGLFFVVVIVVCFLNKPAIVRDKGIYSQRKVKCKLCGGKNSMCKQKNNSVLNELNHVAVPLDVE